MIDSEIISELNKAFTKSPSGFLIVDQGRPSFAVLPYQIYQTLKQKKANPKKIKKILVTGGAGYIGSHAVKLLTEQGFEVVVLDNLSTGRREAVGSARLVQGDLEDEALLDKIFRKERFDAVIHFAASISVEESVANPAKYYRNNVVNGLNLLEAMVAHGVSKLVFSSSAAIYGEPLDFAPSASSSGPRGQGKPGQVDEQAACSPTNPYGETKLVFEQSLKWYAQAYGLASVSLRYFNAAGALPEAGLGYDKSLEHTHLIPRVLDAALGKSPEIEVFGKDYKTSDGTCIRDYIHVLDLASAHIAALHKLQKDPGVHVYNVGTGKGFSVLEIIDEAVEVTGRMIPMKIAARRPGDPASVFADSRKIQKELGWKPEHDLRSIIQSSWDWQKSE